MTRASDACRQRSQSPQVQTFVRVGFPALWQKGRRKGEVDHMAHVYIILFEFHQKYHKKIRLFPI